MKKMFKEHDLVKIIGIMLLLVVVLSWIIPTGTFSSGQHSQKAKWDV